MTDQSTSTPPVANGDGEVVPETRAKQGRRGYHVLTVLIVSLILVLGAFGVIFATHAHTPNAATPAAAQANSRTMNGGGGS